MRCIAGRLLVPPQHNKTLVKLPSQIPFDWVVEYRLQGIVGKYYAAVQRSNEEIAYFLLKAETEIKMEERIIILYSWFTKECEWI